MAKPETSLTISPWVAQMALQTSL